MPTTEKANVKQDSKEEKLRIRKIYDRPVSVHKVEVRTIQADSSEKTKHIWEYTYKNGHKKRNLVALHKKGKGFLTDRRKEFESYYPDVKEV